MRLPSWDELVAVEEQLEVLEYPLDKPLFVAGPPGSGKTVLAVSRAGSVADNDEEKSVALITYNRMLRRLASLLNESSAIPRTMHSFAYRDYHGKTGVSPDSRPSSSYDYDWSRMMATLDGHPNADATWEHAIVDEGQDLPEGFFQYLYEHGAKVLTVFADEDQALGERRTTLAQIQAAANLPHPILLHENHRNRPEIAAVAEHFHSGGLPAAMPRRPAIGERPRLIKKASIADTAEFIANWFANYGGTIGVIVSSNRIGQIAHQELSERLAGNRVDCYMSKENNEDAIALLDDGVTVLNKESVKGQEFDTVFILQLDQFIPCINQMMRRAMYMMCARARDHLFLIYGPEELSSAAMSTLPGPQILERG